MKERLKRTSFAKIGNRTSMPHFLEYQLESYETFVQASKKSNERENIGLERIFRDFFPIVSSYGSLRLEYISYKFEESAFPLNNQIECRKRFKTYSHALKVKFRVADSEGKKIQEAWAFVCDLPKMTERGTFIINGTERVVVKQLHRSPGVFFSKETNFKIGKDILNAKIIPYKGIWLDIETAKDDVLQIKVDRKKRINFSVFVKALGFWKTHIDLLESFFDKVKLKGKEVTKDQLVDSFIGDNLINDKTGEILLEKGDYISEDLYEEVLSDVTFKNTELYKISFENRILANTIIADATKTQQESALELFKKIKSSDVATNEGAKSFIKQGFFSKKYNLSDVGRYKLNKKLEINVDKEEMNLTKDDFEAIIRYILKLQNNEGLLDDIDSLSHRRVRGVGEMLGVQMISGLARIERNAKEKMSMSDPYTVAPQSLLNTKFLYSIIMDFFASGQLSQFMDQTNPLSELSHKRRISSLGKGGLSKDRATFDVRDVHNSHYGRLCPVATPEGPNIGLISSLTLFARINKYGFVETPYLKVEKGKVLFDRVEYLDYDEEVKYFIAQADTALDSKNKMIEDKILCRYASEDAIDYVDRDKVDYIEVSANQITSVSAALIPFLENTDANRALTGSNMQRQAVPLINAEAPYIGTGLEARVANDSGILVKALSDGVVKHVEAKNIIIEDSKTKKQETYELMNFVRSNYTMSMTQIPTVNVGDKIKKGDVIADGPATCNGELSLGRNVLVAFMPFEGYNFEDAIAVSERLVKDDLFTSIHIEEYQIEARSTKLGDEEITRELPNVSDSTIKDLDENGIIRVGAEVRSGDVLVGKITPKGETEEPLAEERLLRAIFGEKARDVKDTSLKLSHGAKGVVVDILELDREKGDDLPSGVNKIIKVFVAEKRKITVGDKMCGRHGNKGIVSKILPTEDMPYLPDGRVIDVLLNPLGVPSRMNIGQVLEAHLGIAAEKLNIHMATPAFDGAKEADIKKYLKKAGLDEDGKTVLYDGRTGEPFDNRITVGVMYMLKLHHLVEYKIHARSIGPYSLVTQQPLGGKAKFGGQRLGEMEVWAIEAHGASSILREMLTIKSDDVVGRTKAYEAMVRGDVLPEPTSPESFNVLIKELRSLGLNVDLYDRDNNKINTVNKSVLGNNSQIFSMSYLNIDEENS